MRIVVNHLTRMQKGCMCVAGIDLETGLLIRPVLDRQMPIEMLAVHGGPFDIARIVDLGETRFVGRVPEVEDQRFEAENARHVGDMPPREFWELLQRHSCDKLRTIFGPDLDRIGETCAVTETFGLRSLGCYWAVGLGVAGRVFVDESQSTRRIRFSWQNPEHRFNLPVTDIRLFGLDHVTACAETVDRLNATIAAGPHVLLSIGLSRPYRKSDDAPPQHWLQVNNFHLADHPCWMLSGSSPFA